MWREDGKGKEEDGAIDGRTGQGSRAGRIVSWLPDEEAAN